MKALFSLFTPSVLLLFSLPAGATPPELPGGMHALEAIEKNIKVATGELHKGCELTVARDTARNRLPFTIKAECATRCGSSASSAHSVALSSKFFFSPEAHKLHIGDGGIPFKSLTGHIEMDARMSCLETAAHFCGGLAKVASSQVNSLSSGNWRAPAFRSCQPDEPTLKSPYHPDFKLRTRPPRRKWAKSAGYQYHPMPRPSSRGRLMGPLPRSIEQYIQEDLRGRVDESVLVTLRSYSLGKINLETCQQKLSSNPESDYSFECDTVTRIQTLRANFQDPATCKNPIRAVACFGDCMGRNAQDPVLGSATPNKTHDITVCGDTLKQELASAPFRSLHGATRELLCEDFSARSILKAGDVFPATEGQTCAAYRLRADCRGF
jgi:hypothetical protein